MKMTKIIAIALATLFFTTASNAQNLLQVEVIVFANESQSAQNEETWPQDITLAYPSNSIQLAKDGETASIYSKLAEQNQSLNDWRDRLRGSRKYRVLAHTTWLQPKSGDQANKPVIITGGGQFGQHFELEGSLQLVGTNHPFKLNTNLWLSKFVPSGSSTEISPIKLPTLETTNSTENNTNTSIYDIKQVVTLISQENITLNKPQYIDHPLINILVKVTEPAL